MAFSKIDLEGHNLPPSPAPSSPRNGKRYALATELVFTEGTDQYNASSTPIYQVCRLVHRAKTLFAPTEVEPRDMIFTNASGRQRRSSKHLGGEETSMITHDQEILPEHILSGIWPKLCALKGLL